MTVGGGEKIGSVLSGVAGLGFSPLVIIGRGGVTRIFGILNFGMCAAISPGIDLRVGVFEQVTT